jgi:hypothetical protein
MAPIATTLVKALKNRAGIGGSVSRANGVPGYGLGARGHGRRADAEAICYVGCWRPNRRSSGPSLLCKRRAISLLSNPDEFSDLGPTRSLKCNGLLTTKGNAQ